MKQTIAIAGFTILGIEILQYAFYLGTFAVSDILLNGLGCLIGFYLATRLEKRVNIKSS
ncbi:VanZ family protein [Latilactobacillus fuchuensis]|uniref:Integral membrane protein n=1 Tax=Latilactobacillus fuchuensis TaxID=164393 RepID=A0A2N9DSZ8_9LACO